jgi:hypothetical protein
MAGHGSQARGNVPDALRSAANADPGLFGRMFDLPPLIVPDDILSDLSLAVLDVGRSSNPAIPAGFT